MKFTMALVLCLAAAPAWAWDNPSSTANATGGSAKAAQHQSQRQVAASHSNASTGPQTAVGGVASISGNYRQAPDVVLPAIGGGGMDCPTVGFGAGGSGLAGGGGFGPSWISSDCNKRKVAAELAQVYGPAVARAYMEREIPGVKEAVAAAAHNEHVEYPYDWCWTRDAGNRRQREVCEGKR